MSRSAVQGLRGCGLAHGILFSGAKDWLAAHLVDGVDYGRLIGMPADPLRPSAELSPSSV